MSGASAGAAPLVFVHIPKTAGSSFRQAAVERFGEDAVAMDYGPASERTSPFVRELLYERQDLPRLAEELRRRRMLSGHFAVTKYLPLLPDAKLVTFLRDPLRRAESEFVVYERVRGYAHGFSTFVERPEIRNKQHAFTAPLSPRHFDFVGRTETYEDDLFRFGRWYGERLPVRHINVRNAPPPSGYDAGLLERFARLHADDLALDALATKVRSLGLPPAPRERPRFAGRWARLHTGAIAGFAFALDSHAPITLSFESGGEVRARTLAASPRPGLVNHQIRILSECGFELARDEVERIEAHGPITVRVEDRGFVVRESLAHDLWP